MDVAKMYEEQVEEVSRLIQEMKNPDGSLKEGVTKEDVDKLHTVIDKLAAVRKKYQKKFNEIGAESKALAKRMAKSKTKREKIIDVATKGGNKVLEMMNNIMNEDGSLKEGVTDEDVKEITRFVNGIAI